MPNAPDFNDRMLSLGLARVSEAAAIACAPLIGRGDEKAAAAPVLIVTHKTTRTALDEALAVFPKTGVLSGEPVAIRIEAV